MKKVEQPAGNYYDKYRTSNPIARALMNGFLRSFDTLLEKCEGVETALEVGCGEGELAIRLAKRGFHTRAFDIDGEIVEEARRRAAYHGVDVAFESRQASELDPIKDMADLVVCCEVLEHLENPESTFRTLVKCTRKYLLVSVPREPVWRALNVSRGKYLSELGNTPGHIQHWSKHSFTSMIGTYADVVEIKSPLPWTMALCMPSAPSRT